MGSWFRAVIVNKSSVLPLLFIAAIFAAILKFGSPTRIDPVACGSAVTPGPDTVIMLGAKWCRYCNRARALLADNKIAYCEYDIEHSKIGEEMYRRTGVDVIPVIYVRDSVIIGFDAEELMQTLIAENIVRTSHEDGGQDAPGNAEPFMKYVD